MDIHKLIEEQLDETRKNQVSYQATIKKRLKKHGFDREKLQEDLTKDFESISTRVVNNALKLGIKWLQE